MRLEIIAGLQILIIAFISYMVTIPFAGWFESLIAKQVGDDAPEQAGFLTLNPLEHFNVFGFAAVLWGIFFGRLLPFQLIPGWGRYIPLVPDNIRGDYYRLRIFTEYIGRSVAHLIILLAAATGMMLLCGADRVHGLMPMLATQMTSFKEVMVLLLLFICQQNVVLFVIHFILGLFKYLIYFHMPRFQEFTFSMIVLGFIMLLVGLSIFGPLLEVFVGQLLESIRLILVYFSK